MIAKEVDIAAAGVQYFIANAPLNKLNAQTQNLDLAKIYFSKRYISRNKISKPSRTQDF